MSEQKDHPALAIGTDLDRLARQAGYARLPGEPDADLRHRAFAPFQAVRWELGARIARYRVVGASEAERATLDRLGHSEFEALSIGREGEGPQVAIIPLDESSREIAQHIVDLHNASQARQAARQLDDHAPRIRFVAEAICAFRNSHVAPSLRCAPEDWMLVAKAAVEAADTYDQRSNSV